MMWVVERRVQGVDAFGRSRDDDIRGHGVGRVDRNGGESFPAAIGRLAEVERFARHRSCQTDRRVGVPGEPIDRQSDEGPDGGLARLDDQASLRVGGSRASERDDARYEQKMSTNAALHGRKLHEGAVDVGNRTPRIGY